MKTWSKRKRSTAVAAMVLFACLIGAWLFTQKRLLSSVSYLSEKAKPENQDGRFLISYLGSNTVMLFVTDREVLSNGSWVAIGPGKWGVLQLGAGMAGELPAEPPAGTNTWRAVIMVNEEKYGIEAWPRKLGLLWDGIRDGLKPYWPDGPVWDGPTVVTREIEP